MPVPRELALTPAQLDELMLTSWNMRIATIGPDHMVTWDNFKLPLPRR